ncbi:MAG: AAA family ATPase [Candidatus Hydrogenedentota bacterium]
MTADSLSAIIGQDRAVAILRSHLATRRIPPTFLFSGPDGVGRALTARAFALALSCEKGTGCAPGSSGSCASCRANSTGEGIRDVDIALLRADETEDNKSAALRRILASHTRTHLLPWLVVIMEHADSMTDSMHSVMLKTAEEPPAGVCYVMLTTSLGNFSPALRSRAAIVRFGPLSEDALRSILPPETSASPLLHCANGSVSTATLLASQYSSEEDLLDKVFFRVELRKRKRVDVLRELSWAVPAAARLRPAWKEALLELDRHARANALLPLAFEVFRNRVGARR